MFEVAWKGIGEFNRAVEETVKQTDRGTRAALAAAARMGAAGARRNVAGPPHVAGGGSVGTGPGVVSGRLRKSIKSRVRRSTRTGQFSASYGAFGVPYAWIVARGSSHARPFPFLPEREVSAALPELLRAEWARSIRPPA